MLTEATCSLPLAWSAQALGALSPEPSAALVLELATPQARAVACGSVVLASATVSGATIVLAQSEDVLTAFRLIGAGYLFLLSWKTLQPTFSTLSASASIQSPHTSFGTVSIQSAALQLSNPKAVLFWLPVASISGVADAPANTAFLFVLGATLVLFLCHESYAIAGPSKQMRRMTARVECTGGIVLALAFAGAGLQLLVSGK